MKTYKIIEEKNQNGYYKRNNQNANYLVCQMGKNIGETVRLDEAIQMMEANLTAEARANDLRIHEFASGTTWYVA